MSNFDKRLDGYVEVKDRIRMFYEAHPEGRLVTAEVRFPEPMDDQARIAVKALAYRSPTDEHPGVGWSWMQLPGSTPYTKGSELENTETSAWGRAIGALGIGIDKSIASTNEIESKSGEDTRVQTQERTDDGGLIGIAEVGTAKDSDFELRETPDGWALGFRLKANGRGGIKVIARDALAQVIALNKDATISERVTCWGRITDESFKKGDKTINYQVLRLERIQTPTYTAPASTTPHPSDVVTIPIAPGQETLPLTDDETAAIAGTLA
jgi:hypothetical protein